MLPSPDLSLQLTGTQGNSLVVQKLIYFIYFKNAMGFIGCTKQLINCSYNVHKWT